VENEMTDSGLDIHAMFEAKMGFSANEIELNDEQIKKFLLLCQQSYLEDEGMMEESHDDDGEIVEDGDMKVIKLHGNDAAHMMDKLLGNGENY
tara:strand:+ start:376 stop:654 length:279 start_codon:yes stop_codon:yes gene_type:complete